MPMTRAKRHAATNMAKSGAIAITGIFGLEKALAGFMPVKLVSILDPSYVIPTPGSIAWHNHMKIQFNDISVRYEGMTMPHDDHMERLIEFGSQWRFDERLLVHCHAGISRSSAAVLILLCQKNPGRENEAAFMLREGAPHIQPNRRMIELADRLLDCRGRLIDALRGMRAPTLRDPQDRFFAFPAVLR